MLNQQSHNKQGVTYSGGRKTWDYGALASKRLVAEHQDGALGAGLKWRDNC